MFKITNTVIWGLFFISFDLLYNLLNGPPVKIGFFDRTILIFGVLLTLFGSGGIRLHFFLKKTENLSDRELYKIFFIILLISIVFRLMLLPDRWINPDEGAHLYDAKFALEGKIPLADYQSRMPLYVYILSFFLEIFGESYLAGRLLPFFSNVGIGIIIFLIGDQLFNNKRISLLASTIYLFTPLSIIWSVVVKTELPETLFGITGLYLFLNHIKNDNYYNIFFSGIFFAFAYYIRKSAIVFPITTLIFLIYIYWSNLVKLLKSYGVLVLGYLSVVLGVFLFFSSVQGFNSTWNSDLNMLNTVIDPFQTVFDTTVGLPSEENLMTGHQQYSETLAEWKLTLKYNSFLLVGFLLFFLILMKSIYMHDNSTERDLKPLIFLCIWTFSIFLFLLLYSFRTSFFNQYFGEILPPLSLILSYIVIYPIKHAKFKNFGIITGFFIIALFLSSLPLIDSSFGGVWAPETVNDVSKYIKTSPIKEKVVLSGAMIWAFESNSKPFMNETHPLSFLREMTNSKLRLIENKLRIEKPDFIVMDGYTESIYFQSIQELHNTINKSYVLKKDVRGSKYPVRVYELKS
jgi:hypothetical protein